MSRIIRQISIAHILLLAAWAIVPHATFGQTLIPRNGESFTAELSDIQSDGKFVFSFGGQRQTLAAGEFLSWGEFKDSDRGSQIVMCDGSWLIADVQQIESEKLKCYSSLWGDLDLPLNTVRGILFNPSVDPRKRDTARDRITSTTGTADRLYLENGDSIDGNALRIEELEAGLAKTTAQLMFSAQGREVPLSLNTITAIVFNPARATGQPIPAEHVVLGLKDGSRLVVETIEVDGEFVRLDLVGRLRLETDRASLIDELRFVQPFDPKIVFISDLQPAGYKHIPMLTQTLPLGRNRNLQDEAVRCDNSLYEKALVMPSASRASYSLDGQYKTFAAEIALEDHAGNIGNVIFRVYLIDATGQLHAAFSSPIVRRGDPPQSVRVDIQNARTLALIIDMAERGDVQDHAVWLNARLIKEEE